ncbi:DEAD/DEAH box helicase family protein [Mycoplasma bradburyae]|uniref:DEAD/DEAH box helicase family protein n=1 Tax=Mycoplasma bradburyae TaxID=2963128 RepID=UPI002340D33C|nr:DEAD/DEAH box helicase family protein [Mycoplasma bradburyae]MDC4183003.1 DEAD/DEAH box helicase family protein [Mycoplasma bradburyae]
MNKQFILSKVQEKAVNQLVDYWVNKEDKIKKVYFKAPTGSGKTFMIANVIDRIINKNEIKNKRELFFIIATPSSADLPKQLETKLNDYKIYLSNTDLEIDFQDSPSSSKTKTEKDFILLPKHKRVMIFGKSSFGGGKLFTERGIIDSLFDDIKNNDNLDLIYIRDEAHIGVEKKNSKDVEDFESKIAKIASFSIFMTATPKKESEVVEITEEELFADETKLLKWDQHFNEGIPEDDEIDDERILRIACEKFKEIKSQYGSNDNPGLLGTNPAMLIQIKNKSSKEEESTIQKLLQKYISVVEEFGFSWVKYFSEDKSTNDSNIREGVTLKNLSKNNSGVDVIFIKIGPATGWDIPRATMLVQLREIFSDSLNIQTIGRIKRNPNPRYKFEKDNIAFKYWIYSNFKNHGIVNQQRWTLKKPYKQKLFPVGKIDTSNLEKTFNKAEYIDKITKILSNKDNFLSRQNELINYYKNHNYLIREEKQYAIDNKDKTSTRIISKIYDKLDLKLFINEAVEQNKAYFILDQKNYIDLSYDEIQKTTDEIDEGLYKYIVIKDYLSDIKSHYASCNKIQEFDKKVILSYESIPNEMFVNTDKPKTAVIDEIKELFVYEQNQDKQNKLYLDSSNEKEFIKILKGLTSNQNLDYIWSVNPVFKGLNFQFIDCSKKDKPAEIKDSFPDFFFVIKDRHFLFMEIKDDKDTGELSKPEMLLNYYQKYVETFKDNLIAKKDNKTLTMVIYRPSKDSSGNGSMEGFSTIESVNEKLNDENVGFKRLKALYDEIKKF